jgi:hypothetical protein
LPGLIRQSSKALAKPRFVQRFLDRRVKPDDDDLEEVRSRIDTFG